MVPIKPKRLNEGDTIAVLSPSWGGPSRFPHVFDLGLRNIESRFGLKIKEYPTARMDADETYRNPKIRAEDINKAFADPEVSAIIASIGGDDSVRILPFLDLETILANPKIFMGYSDTTAISTYLNFNGLVTFNGPSIMAGFAQLRYLPDSFTDHIRQILMKPFDTLQYEPYDQWTNQYVEWTTPGYDGEVSPLLENAEKWHWLQGENRVQGRLFGGCIEVLEFLKGTPFWPDGNFFKNKILFFETSEDKPTVSILKYMLRNYGSAGILESLNGILFGRARSYSDQEKADLDKMIVQVVSGEFGRSDMPIVTNLDFGHTDPQIIMPIGILAEIDRRNRSFALKESVTK